ncbi:secreted arabinase [Auriculariales sp. MPI-PUGE-AT-0066]|nr:secreted arabinase [Auriculariales sp. MPI-PUGE-AT-0066]
MILTRAAILLTAALGAWAQPNPGAVTGYTNAHDPTICKAGSTWFAFTTGVGIPILTSTDRTAWKLSGVMWPSGASWTNEYTGQANANLWAPECYYDGSKFWVYYSASTFGSQKSAIFLATSTTGAPGSWTNQGLVISSANGSAYNAIDPSLLVDNGKWYLSWGSFWTGIYFTSAVNPSTGKLTSTTSSNIAARPGNTAIEGNSIFKSGSYYYLFTSWDKCCSGTSSTYNIRVGRSTSVSGPYVDVNGVALTSGGGTLVLGSHGSITGPGGQDVYQDSDGPILVYHYYNSQGSFLGINKLNFTSGWPVVI